MFPTMNQATDLFSGRVRLNLYCMKSCWTSSPLLSTFSVNVWTAPGVGPTCQWCRLDWTGLDWGLEVMLPQEVGCLVTCPCSFIMSMKIRCELSQDGLPKLDVNSPNIISGVLNSFWARLWLNSASESSCGPSFLCASSISGWRADFASWPGRGQLTPCCGCERKLWGQTLWVWICPFVFGALSESCPLLGHQFLHR